MLKERIQKKACFSRGMPFHSLAISTYCLFCFLREISIVLLMKNLSVFMWLLGHNPVIVSGISLIR